MTIDPDSGSNKTYPSDDDDDNNHFSLFDESSPDFQEITSDGLIHQLLFEQNDTWDSPSPFMQQRFVPTQQLTPKHMSPQRSGSSTRQSSDEFPPSKSPPAIFLETFLSGDELRTPPQNIFVGSGLELSPFDEEKDYEDYSRTPVGSPLYSPQKSQINSQVESSEISHTKSPMLGQVDPYSTPPYSPTVSHNLSQTIPAKRAAKRRLSYERETASKRQKTQLREVKIKLNSFIDSFIEKIQKLSFFAFNESNVKEILSTFDSGYKSIYSKSFSLPEILDQVFSKLFANNDFLHLFFQYSALGVIHQTSVNKMIFDIFTWTGLPYKNTTSGYMFLPKTVPVSFIKNASLKIKVLTRLLKSFILFDFSKSDFEQFSPIIHDACLQLGFLISNSDSIQIKKIIHNDLLKIYTTEVFQGFLQQLLLADDDQTNLIIESLFSILFSSKEYRRVFDQMFEKSNCKKGILFNLFRYINLCSSNKNTFPNVHLHKRFLQQFFLKLSKKNPELLIDVAKVWPYETVTALAEIKFSCSDVNFSSQKLKFVEEMILLMNEDIELALYLQHCHRCFTSESLNIAASFFGEDLQVWNELFANFGMGFLINVINKKLFECSNSFSEIEVFLLKSWVLNIDRGCHHWIRYVRDYQIDDTPSEKSHFLNVLSEQIIFYLEKGSDLSKTIFNEANFSSLFQSMNHIDKIDMQFVLKSIMKNILENPDSLSLLVNLITNIESLDLKKIIWSQLSVETRGMVLASLFKSYSDLTRFTYFIIPNCQPCNVQNFKSTLDCAGIDLEEFLDKIKNTQNDSHIEGLKGFLIQ